MTSFTVAPSRNRTLQDIFIPDGLRSALEGDDLEVIKTRATDLMQAQMKFGEAMYKAAQAAGPDASAAGAGKAKDDVIDAEFREVDDDKKKSA